MPAKDGDMLTKCEQKDSLSAECQTGYQAVTGKAMHVMQYSRGKIYNSVRDCARHVHMAAKKHMDAIL